MLWGKFVVGVICQLVMSCENRLDVSSHLLLVPLSNSQISLWSEKHCDGSGLTGCNLV